MMNQKRRMYLVTPNRTFLTEVLTCHVLEGAAVAQGAKGHPPGHGISVRASELGRFLDTPLVGLMDPQVVLYLGNMGNCTVGFSILKW